MVGATIVEPFMVRLEGDRQSQGCARYAHIPNCLSEAYSLADASYEYTAALCLYTVTHARGHVFPGRPFGMHPTEREIHTQGKRLWLRKLLVEIFTSPHRSEFCALF